MNSDSAHSELWEAYRATSYEALDGDAVAWRVRIDELSPVAGPMAYITADNPRSKKLSADKNHRRRAELRAELESLPVVVRPGKSVADDGDWPVELGFWIRPIECDTARELAARYGQNAFVFVDEKRRVHLVASRSEYERR